MFDQTTLNLAAATVGFIAAVFFCIGNASNTSTKILLQSTPFYDFSEPVARALAAQRAQYAVGGILLLIAFGLQVLAALASAATPASLSQSLRIWSYPMLVVLLATGLTAAGLAVLLYKTTMQKVLRMERERRAKEAT